MQRRQLLRRSASEMGDADLLAGISAPVCEDAPEAHAVSPTSGTDPVKAAERSIVGALLRDNRIFDSVADHIRAQDFLDPVMSTVFSAVVDIVEGRINGITVADPVSVSAMPGIERVITLKGLQDLAAQATSDLKAVESYASIVRGASKERGLKAAVEQAQSLLEDKDKSLELRSEEIVRLLSGAGEVRKLPVVPIGLAATEALTEMVERANSGKSGVGIPTGFADLDALTAGLHGGQLIIVAARPGVGKTAFALSMALNAAAQSVQFLFASLEMKARELSKRALSVISGVDSHAIRMGALNESDWEGIVNAGERLAAMPLSIVDLPSVNMSALSGLCRRLHREGKLDVLVVDYLQILETSGGRNATREQLIAELSRGLKKLAMQLDIPVIALSQLSRAVESRASRRPQLSDLRESGAIEQDADVVIFVHRETGAQAASMDTQLAEIIVEKQRAGPPGEIQLVYTARTTSFSDVSSFSPIASY